jgi:hypothetical protein
MPLSCVKGLPGATTGVDLGLMTDHALLTVHHRAVLEVERLATDMVCPNMERLLEPAYIIAFSEMVSCRGELHHRNILVTD